MSVIHEEFGDFQNDFLVRKGHLNDIETLNDLISPQYR